jgi:hypothetical protein
MVAVSVIVRQLMISDQDELIEHHRQVNKAGTHHGYFDTPKSYMDA